MKLTDILLAIDACALNPGQWHDVLELVIDYMGGNGATLFSVEATPQAKGLWTNARLDPESVAEYVRYYQKIDPWYRAVFARGLVIPGAIYSGNMLVPAEQLHETEYYRDFLVRFNNVDLLLAIFHDSSHPPVPTVALSIYRGAGAPAFTEADIARLAPLIPRLQLATAVNFQLADRDHRIEVQGSLLGTLGPALVLLDANGKIVHTGPATQTLLDNNDGLGIQDAHLRLTDRTLQQSLASLIAPSQPANADSVLRIPRRNGKPPLVILRVPLPFERVTVSDVRRPACALLVYDPDSRPRCNSGALRSLFGLTTAEIRVAEALISIGTLPTIATELGVSEHTVRTQIKSVFYKTGTNRQADLVRLLLSLPTPAYDPSTSG